MRTTRLLEEKERHLKPKKILQCFRYHTPSPKLLCSAASVGQKNLLKAGAISVRAYEDVRTAGDSILREFYKITNPRSTKKKANIDDAAHWIAAQVEEIKWTIWSAL